VKYFAHRGSGNILPQPSATLWFLHQDRGFTVLVFQQHFKALSGYQSSTFSSSSRMLKQKTETEHKKTHEKAYENKILNLQRRFLRNITVTSSVEIYL